MTDKDWPLQLWDQLTTHALITLNLLCTSCIDPKKSAYHQLFGHQYDWNAHPLAPPGTKAIVYESPLTQKSWGCRGMDAWYCGPAMDHYRNSKFFVPATKAYRISGSFDLFPQHCILPTFAPEQHVDEVHRELFESVQRLTKPAKKTFLCNMAKSLQVLTKTPENDVTNADMQTSEGVSTSANEATIRRVNTTEVTTTNDPTDSRNLLMKPSTH